VVSTSTPELGAVRTVVDPTADRLNELAGRDHRGMADYGDQIAPAAGFARSTEKPFSECGRVTGSTKPARTSVELAVRSPCHPRGARYASV
jgi:hypothetical protein